MSDEKITIEKLARMSAEMESLQKDMAGALDNSMTSPEYLALDVAREELDRKDAQYREQEDWKEYEGYTKKMAKLSEDLEACTLQFKAERVAEYLSNGTKEYPGGRIQVRKNLQIFDRDELVALLARFSMLNLLQVNEKALKKFDSDQLELLRLNQVCGWGNNPIATVFSDLSLFDKGVE